MTTTATAVKERPIMFSGDMVTAIQDDTKAQTRRVIKPQPEPFRARGKIYWAGQMPDGTLQDVENDGLGRFLSTCPYGVPGDRLWVKEAWSPKSNAGYLNEDDGSITITYADGATKYVDDYGDVMGDWTIPDAAKKGPLTPIFMPRWASRLTLEITGVRVERVASISPADCLAEGIDLAGRDTEEVRGAFRRVWDALNAKRDGGAYAWAKAPWVWVIEVRKLEN